MDHFEVKIGKVEEPTGLAVIEMLGLMKVDEVLVMGKDLYWGGRALEVMSPGF